MKWLLTQIGPFQIREIRLGGYKVRTYYTVDPDTTTDNDARMKRYHYWQPVPQEIFFRVTRDGKIVNSFLTFDAAKRWCEETATMNTKDLEHEIRDAINRHCAENPSDTPDFILAEYLMACLDAFNAAIQARETWYGRTKQSPICEEQSSEITTAR